MGKFCTCKCNDEHPCCCFLSIDVSVQTQYGTATTTVPLELQPILGGAGYDFTRCTYRSPYSTTCTHADLPGFDFRSPGYFAVHALQESVLNRQFISEDFFGNGFRFYGNELWKHNLILENLDVVIERDISGSVACNLLLRTRQEFYRIPEPGSFTNVTSPYMCEGSNTYHETYIDNLACESLTTEATAGSIPEQPWIFYRRSQRAFLGQASFDTGATCQSILDALNDVEYIINQSSNPSFLGVPSGVSHSYYEDFLTRCNGNPTRPPVYSYPDPLPQLAKITFNITPC